MKCYASDYCQKDKSSCSDVCGGYRVLRALYNLSRIPERYRYTIALKPENGEDLEAFTVLDNYKNDVLNMVDEGRGLYIWGKSTGNGKTSWACKIMSYFFRKIAFNTGLENEGLYIFLPTFLEDLRDNYDNKDPEFDEVLRMIKTCRLLIIDDIGAERVTDWVRERMVSIINTRVSNNLTTITGTKYDINNLADVYTAIGVIQDKLNITGTTAREAEQTFSGSFAMMKASVTNLLGNLSIGDGEAVARSMGELVESASTFFFGNFIPMLQTIFSNLPTAIGTAVEKVAPQIKENVLPLLTSIKDAIFTGLGNIGIDTGALQAIFDQLFNVKVDGGGIASMFSGLKDGIVQAINTILPIIPPIISAVQQIAPVVGQVISTIMSGVSQIIPYIVPVIQTITNIIVTAMPVIQQIITVAVSVGLK